MSSTPQHHPTVTKERLDKALDPAYLPNSSTNLSDIRWKATHPADSLGVHATEGLQRISFSQLNPGALEFTPVQGAVFLVFDSSCEAAVYDDSGALLTGLTGCDSKTSLRGSRRAELRIDTKSGSSGTLYIEVACNGLFGGDGALVGKVDPAQSYALSSAHLALLHTEGHGLAYDLLVVNDLAGGVVKEAGGMLPARALAVGNAMLNVVERRDDATYSLSRAIGAEILRPGPGAGAGAGAGAGEGRGTVRGKGSPKDTAQELAEAHEELHDTLSTPVVAVGHCHIDTAWLWPFAETRRKIARSWASQLYLMDKEDARFTFVASQAAHYAWLRDDQPQLFDRVRAAVAGGRFIPVGVSWVEPDANMPSGESLVRQLLYGAAELKGKLGKEIVQAAVQRAQATGAAIPSRVPLSDVYWLPDTFGYCPQLPAILRGAGMTYFLTQKLSWSLVNKPAHNTFWWTALDGSSVLAHFPPADTYCANATVDDVMKSSRGNKDVGRAGVSMMLYGVGDGGGGPNAPMLEQLRRMGAGSLVPPGPGIESQRAIECLPLPTLPRVLHGHPTQFFHALAGQLARAGGIDYDAVTWQGELFLELHNGTLTSQAATKAGNRRAERALHAAELYSVIAELAAQQGEGKGEAGYPHEALRAAWKDVLTCQFHDVLPGSSIQQVARDAEGMLASAYTKAGEIGEAGRVAVAQYLGTQASTDKDGKPTARETAKAFGGATSGHTGASAVQARKVFRIWNATPYPRLEVLPVPAVEGVQEVAAGARAVLIGVHAPAMGVVEVPVDVGATTLAQIEKQRALLGRTGDDADETGPQVQVVEPAQRAAAADPGAGIPSAELPDLGSSAPRVAVITRLSEARDCPTATRLRVYELQPKAGAEGGAVEETTLGNAFVVDTGVIRLVLSRTTGHILSLLDYRVDPSWPREVIERPGVGDGFERARPGVQAAMSAFQGGNRFLLADDTPFFWDAWDFFPYGLEKVDAATGAAPAPAGASSSGAGEGASSDWTVRTAVIEAGPLRARIRVSYPCLGRGGGWLAQDIILTYGSPHVEFLTTVEWREEHKMLKVEFPLTVKAQVAVYETQFGCVSRPTHTNTSRDAMMHEVCCHRWADLSAPDYGVALMNDSKYGASCRGSRMRLSLLRSPKAPDPTCDMGRHVFRYALLPHLGHVTATDDVLQAAASLNQPLAWEGAGLPVLQMAKAQAMMARTGSAAKEIAAGTGSKAGPAPTPAGSAAPSSAGASSSSASASGGPSIRPPTKFRSLSFFTLLPMQQSVLDNACCSIVLDTVKWSKDGKGIIVRLYESLGRTARAKLACAWPMAAVKRVNLLEEEEGQEGLEVPGGVEPSVPRRPHEDAVLSCAPASVRAAFAKHAPPAAPTGELRIEGEEKSTVEVKMGPFQILTLRITPGSA